MADWCWICPAPQPQWPILKCVILPTILLFLLLLLVPSWPNANHFYDYIFPKIWRPSKLDIKIMVIYDNLLTIESFYWTLKSSFLRQCEWLLQWWPSFLKGQRRCLLLEHEQSLIVFAVANWMRSTSTVPLLLLLLLLLLLPLLLVNYLNYHIMVNQYQICILFKSFFGSLLFY